jgi:hypothetical protein
MVWTSSRGKALAMARERRASRVVEAGCGFIYTELHFGSETNIETDGGRRGQIHRPVNGPLADVYSIPSLLYNSNCRLGLERLNPSRHCVPHDSSPSIFLQPMSLTRQPTATNSQLKPNHLASLSLCPGRVSGLLPTLLCMLVKSLSQFSILPRIRRNTLCDPETLI